MKLKRNSLMSSQLDQNQKHYSLSFLRNKLFWILILLWSQASLAASMTSPSIRYSFLTKDLKPIKGVSLMGTLQYDTLSSMDCSGFICMPSLPHWTSKSEASVEVGSSSESGILIIPQMSWSSEEIISKNPRIHYFTNGLLENICGGNKKAFYSDYLNLFSPDSTGTSLQINSQCMPKLASDGDDEIEMYCLSAFTEAELNVKKAQIIEDCE